MAPVSGPLTQGVAGTQPSARAALMLRKRAVACRTFSMSGDDSSVPAASAEAAGKDATASPHNRASNDGLELRYMRTSLARIAQLRMSAQGIGACTGKNRCLHPVYVCNSLCLLHSWEGGTPAARSRTLRSRPA